MYFRQMNSSRRDFSLLLPALLAAVDAQGAETTTPALPSKCYDFTKLPVKVDPKTHNESRQVFDGFTHRGHEIDLHITTLSAGQMPHPPHHHAHEEMIFIKEGMLEVYIKDQTSRVGPGSVVYVNSNEEHGWKNIGDTSATYFVLAVGKEGKE
jgi:quercetin dioxygenase-like cupin family protein